MDNQKGNNAEDRFKPKKKIEKGTRGILIFN